MQMNLSNSKHWLGTWGLLFLALLTVVLGFFTLPADSATGGGFLLFGIAGILWMGWLLRRGKRQRSAKERWGVGMVTVSSIGLGFFLIAAGDPVALIPVKTTDQEKVKSLSSPSSGLSTSSLPVPPTTLTATSTATSIVTSTVHLEPEHVTVTSSVFMAPREATTTQTIYLPAPQQNFQPPEPLGYTEPRRTGENPISTLQHQPEQTEESTVETVP